MALRWVLMYSEGAAAARVVSLARAEKCFALFFFVLSDTRVNVLLPHTHTRG